MFTLVLVRHGQSTWNQENRFTGWTDVDLTGAGRAEASAAGELLAREGYTFDLAFTSYLRRAIRTLWIVQDEMDLMWIEVLNDWRLNERHYGALQGLNKAETAGRYGEEQVHVWRRSYDTRPPLLEAGDERHPGREARYSRLGAGVLPLGESLKDTVGRVLPCWKERIAPAILAGRKVLISAHGNSLRALAMYLDGLSEADVVALNIPTGIPLVYSLDASLKPLSHRYLGDPEAIRKAAEAVAAQGRKKEQPQGAP